MYNAAIIGVSGFGDVHYNDLKRGVKNSQLKIIAATIINQDEEQEKCSWLKSQGTMIYSDWMQMLDKNAGNIDICFIPTGISMHAPMSIRAMRTGANVFVEKPVAATIQEVYEIQQAASETAKFVAIGYDNIYQPDTQTVKQLLLDDGIGKLKCLKAKGFCPRTNVYYSRNDWAGKLKTGDNWILDSPFNNALAHYLNMLCYFAGGEFDKSAELKQIRAELYRANKIQSPDAAALEIITQDDVKILFYATHATKNFAKPYIEIHGTEGIIIFDFAQNNVEIKPNTGPVEHIRINQPIEYRQNIMYALERRLESGNSFICSLDIARAQTICANGAHESSPVNAIASKYIKTMVDGESELKVINNIEDIINHAFDENKLLNDTGKAPWTVPGQLFDLTNYKFFNGGAR